MAKKFWIQDAIKKEGALRKSLGTKKGDTISVRQLNKAMAGGGITAKRASLAKTLRSFHK